jgi:valyl-tRNA synthetase
VTGDLTLGHMLGGTVQDAIIRWHRMRGDPTLWLPGVDHAGLATQVRVRNHLAQQGVFLENLRREEVIRRVDAWKQEHERRIRAELDAAGFSLDWSRYRYTMDPAYARATRRAFVSLYRAGLVYRGERFVNWDPAFKTAISDLEVEHTTEPARLLFVRYPWADPPDDPRGGLVVATVRPETIFGDVAVAVHPDDPRHAAAVGRRVRVPLTDRVVPVIADPAIDREFGNGSLKITPRHDPLDYEIFQRHPELPMPPEIFDEEARLTSSWVPGQFRGLDRDTARQRTTEALAAEGALEREEAYVHSVGRSERSEAVIEPRLSEQWFVRMEPLAGPAVAAIREGTIRFFPERWERTFYRWMDNLQDWCISRQIVWGHPIPVYYCDGCGAQIVEEEPPVSCPTCGRGELRSDPDVFDTWFSSWLWPFATLGWPDETPDLDHYFPTSALVTGPDIMFFWVARMIMAGFYFRQRPPFRAVHFTGLLRDESGRKLSKHLGNSPDPLAVIHEWGADALRFGLLFPGPADQDGVFGSSSLEGARNFLTKVWNLGRFSLSHVGPGADPPDRLPPLPPSASLENRWILTRWRRTVEVVDAAFERFELSRVAAALHGFLWHDLADRYVEVAKDALLGQRGEPARRESRNVLLFVFERTLRLLHPIAPHLTEELWHALPHRGELLAQAPWPSPEEAPQDAESLAAMEVVYDAIRTFRNLRAEARTPPGDTPVAWARPAHAEARRLLVVERALIERQARVRELSLLENGADPPAAAAPSVTPHGEFFLTRPSLREGSPGYAALRREREKLIGLLEKAQQRLHDPGFRSRAPPEVLRETEEKARELAERMKRIDDHLEAAP